MRSNGEYVGELCDLTDEDAYIGRYTYAKYLFRLAIGDNPSHEGRFWGRYLSDKEIAHQRKVAAEKLREYAEGKSIEWKQEGWSNCK